MDKFFKPMIISNGFVYINKLTTFQQLSAMNMEPTILKKYLLLLLRASDDLSFERFKNFFDEALEQVLILFSTIL